MTTPTPAIDARDLTRTYRAHARRRRRRDGASPATVRTALDGVSLRVERAEWVALLGPNGSGKSTLLRILATLDAPDIAGDGSLRLLGNDTPSRERRSIGVVFQREALDPLLTGRENLRTHAMLFGLSRADARARIDDVARRLGIADRLDDRVSTLSGGLRRRVDLARALLTSPEILYLDEPTTGLDHASRVAFLETLAAIRRERHMTVVLATHLMDEAAHADRVVMLSNGRIVADGAPAELRAALGDAVLRAEDPAARETLDRFGLTVSDVDGRPVATGPAQAAADAAAALTSAGLAFSFGPPTLADVYLARTGRSLGATTESRDER